MALTSWLHDADGDFADLNQWSGGAVPGPSDFAHITASGTLPYKVTSSASETVTTLHLGATATLDITAGAFTATDGTGLSGTDFGDNAGDIVVEAGAGLTLGGTLTNDGLVDLASTLTSKASRLSVSASGLVLAGTGVVSLAAGGVIQGAAAGATLTSYGTIAGYGEIGVANLSMVNGAGGVIRANNPAHILSINMPTLVNKGLIDDEGNELFLSGVTVNGAGGTIVVGAYHALVLVNSSMHGGSLTTGKESSVSASYGHDYLSFAPTDAVSIGGQIYAVNGPQLTITGGTLHMAGGVINSGGGSVVDFEGATVTDASGAADLQTQDYQGVIRIGDASAFQIGGFIFNDGTIALVSNTHDADLSVVTGAILGGAGTITMSGADARILGTTASAALTNESSIVGTGFVGANQLSLTNAASGVIEATGVLTVRDSAGHSLANTGLMEASITGKLALVAETIDQSGGGTILASGGLVTLQAVDVIGGTLRTVGPGRINVAGGAVELDGSTSAVTVSGLVQVTKGQTLTVAGVITDTSAIDLVSAAMVVAASGATLSGKGQVNLNASATNVITGASAAATLTNVNNRIDGAGFIGIGSMTLVNQAAGQIVGNQNLVLTIDTGTNTIVNSGLIENVGKGGTLVRSAVNNTGTLLAATTGALILTGAVTGTGVGQINGGTLNVQLAYAENVIFSGTTGVLELGDSQAFTGKVTGFSKTGSTALDLVDIGFFAAKTKATYSGTTVSGTLTVTDGTHTAHIALVGNYAGSTWTVSADGQGGTKVVDPVAGAFSQAMASSWAVAPAHPPGSSLGLQSRMPTLHAQA